MERFGKRDQIISYVAPHVRLFPTTYALVFGTRHGVGAFADEIFSLYHRGYCENVIVSGGATGCNTASEAQVMCRELSIRGIPARAIVLEERALNTGENVVFSRALFANANIEELLLIGKISSKRRYMMTMKKQWPEVKRICCHGVNYFSSTEQLWWQDKEFRRRVLDELRKVRFYIERDFISEISIVSGIVL